MGVSAEFIEKCSMPIEQREAFDRALNEPGSPEAGRCLACGQFIKNFGFMCDACGKQEDRERASL